MKNLVSILLIALLVSFPAFFSAQTNSPKETALEMLGSLSAVVVYNTYIAVGAVADGADISYDTETCSLMLDEQISMMTNLDEKFMALLQSGFVDDPADQEYVRQLVTCCQYLKSEATTLKSYLSTDLQADLDAYNYSRDQAWSTISGLLGLDE